MYKMIILINGKKRSGKDHFAKLLSNELHKLHKTTEIMSFADPIKEIIACTLGINIKELDIYKNNENYTAAICREFNFASIKHVKSIRTVIQTFGTEAMQNVFGKDVWVNKLYERSKKSKADVIIVPDFRFLHEKISQFTINIIDNNIKSEDSHASENSLDDFDFKYVIDNTGHPDLTQEARILAELFSDADNMMLHMDTFF